MLLRGTTLVCSVDTHTPRGDRASRRTWSHERQPSSIVAVAPYICVQPPLWSEPVALVRQEAGVYTVTAPRGDVQGASAVVVQVVLSHVGGARLAPVSRPGKCSSGRVA